MKKLALTVTLVFGLLASIPAISLGGKGELGTEDSCAASIGLDDASACGNGGGTILYGPWYENGIRLCVWYNPSLSPSVWVAPC